jgi:Mn-containing catalase
MKETSEVPALRDAAIAGSAAKVEHYEISSYKTARTLAGQIGRPDVALLLNLTLGEEETSESLLTQIARELMSESRTGISKDDELTDANTGSAKRGTRTTTNQS